MGGFYLTFTNINPSLGPKSKSGSINVSKVSVKTPSVHTTNVNKGRTFVLVCTLGSKENSPIGEEEENDYNIPTPKGVEYCVLFFFSLDGYNPFLLLYSSFSWPQGMAKSGTMNIVKKRL